VADAAISVLLDVSSVRISVVILFSLFNGCFSLSLRWSSDGRWRARGCRGARKGDGSRGGRPEAGQISTGTLALRRTRGSAKPPQDHEVRRLERVECSIDLRFHSVVVAYPDLAFHPIALRNIMFVSKVL
jgi:hypothetical protein